MHAVKIDSYGMTIPDSVRDYAQNIMDKKRNSPGLTEEKMVYAREHLSSLDNADQEIPRMGLTEASVFSMPVHYTNAVARGVNIPFDSKAVPYTSGYGLKPIVTPKPDLHYDYPSNSFNLSESVLMQHNRLSSYAAPNSANFWLFFAVEFKSPSRGDSDWVAENQNAGIGVHSVNSIETLMNYTRDKKQRKMIASVFFPCVVDVSHASLWVHWKTLDDDPQFVCEEMNFYRLKKPADLRAFRAAVKNVIDHGINERLSMIKKALNDVLPQVPEWQRQERASKASRA